MIRKAAGLLSAAAVAFAGAMLNQGSAWGQMQSTRNGAAPSAGAVTAPAIPEAQKLRIASAPISSGRMRMSQLGLPLRFEQNVGQFPGVTQDNSILVGLGAGYRVRLAPAAVAVDLPGLALSGDTSRTSTLSLRLAGANPRAAIVPEDRLPGTDSYYTGVDESTWHTGLATFSRVTYRRIYPGIDAAFYGRGDQLEYDVIAGPGADLGKVRFKLDGMRSVEVDSAGDLRLRIGSSEVRLLKPTAYQLSADGKSRKNVDVRYRLRGNRLSFVAGKYNHGRPLTIDPVLDYATYLSSSYSYATAVAADAGGNSYVAIENSAETGFSVLKFDPSGNLLQTATLASQANAAAFINGIAVSGSGAVYLAGSGGRGLPTSSNSYQTNDKNTTTALNAYMAVLTPVSSALQLTYSSYLGGVANGAYGSDYGWGIAVDAQGNAYVSGIASGDSFPTTAGVYQTTYDTNTTSAEFVAKFTPSLSGASSLAYSTLIGSVASGNGFDAIAVDGAGNAYVAANVPVGSDVPITQGALNYSGDSTGVAQLYLTKLNATASAVTYSGYLGPAAAFGGYLSVNGAGVAVDGSGDAYVTGTSAANDFPTTAGAYQTSYPGAFVSEVSPDGTSMIYSTFLGGPSSAISPGGSEPTSISIPAGCLSACNVYVAGATTASDFPAINAIQGYQGATQSGFAVELNGTGTAAVYSTLLGGTQSNEVPVNISVLSPYTASPTAAIDGQGNLYVAGNVSQVLDFPVTPTPGQAAPGNAYLAKIGPSAGTNVVAVPSSVQFSATPVGVSTLVNFGVSTPVALRNMGSQSVTLNPLALSPSAVPAQ